jgi:hypothetical protein
LAVVVPQELMYVRVCSFLEHLLTLIQLYTLCSIEQNWKKIVNCQWLMS